MITTPNAPHIAVKKAAMGKWAVAHIDIRGPRHLASFGDYQRAVSYARAAATRDRLPLKVAKPDSIFRPREVTP